MNAHLPLRLSLNLTVRSPFMFRGLDSSAFGVDVACLRDEQDRPIIPADQIRGVLREALGDLAAAGAGITASEIDEIFGRKSADLADDASARNVPDRTRILFGDLHAAGMVLDPDARAGAPHSTELPLGSAIETARVQIDDVTGAAETGKLQFIELAAPFGAAVRFAGEIVLFVSPSQAGRWSGLLNRALGIVGSIGAFKSVGFGEVLQLGAQVQQVAQKAPAKASSPLPERFTLRAWFDRPILVDAERIADNAFAGREVVPGAVFKGALARNLELTGRSPETGELGVALAALSFSHAFPESSEAGQRDLRPLPLSMVAALPEGQPKPIVGDALLVPGGQGAMIAGRAALFQSDWKGGWFTDALAAMGRPQPRHTIGIARTHTKIDATTGTAETGALYTTIARPVELEGAPRAWLLDIDFTAVPAGAVRDELEAAVAQCLATGLHGIGKTGASARFELVAETSAPLVAPIHGTTDEFALVLEAPALMLDRIAVSGEEGWSCDPEQAYAAYFQRVLPGAQLLSFFASQKLAGGYLARRRRAYGDGLYQPFLLTEAGSVFRLRVSDPEPLHRLIRSGLPATPLSGVAAVTWANCPFVPENGYGRISADHLSGQVGAKLTGVVQHV
ncbi:RAMP superfamily CRISPR-associated protein [Xanthobacter sp. AM11]|uniref:RAMP superfamily CRISPR-associated protein n=1 Tax=Xanthobacter sp. AM11 TaxID=3380643 RepID=UPI0039BEE1B7